ncbi:MAG: hypothetical protein WCX82_01690 [archaeon]|jgi:hypothetical protein
MPLKKLDIIARFKKPRINKNLEIEKHINSKNYSFSFWLKPNKNYLELRFVKNKSVKYTSDMENHTIDKFNIIELTENINKAKQMAKENNIKYIVMDTWIFNKKHPHLLSLFCKKFNLEFYNIKTEKTDKYMNWLLFRGKLKSLFLKEYPRYIFKIKD